MTDSSLVKAARVSIVFGVLVASAFAFVSSFLFPKPPVPLARVNGVYANDHCGLLTMKDGMIIWGSSHAEFSLETDKGGLFAITKYFVGVSNNDGRCKIVSNSQQYPLYLRFNDENHPTMVSLLSYSPDVKYTFSRKP
ncbi:hypothetical protein [Novosphingobium sp. KACC 22771]|uniref:hypothetical protein n=1 Tax=Novosphingobium sp. KACC 22771 TaxID=3025670 RepID=UPI002365B70C|nr:hypothetical protein [Novosphingobium sp. KACC 22771]WDF72639.1 hypothetical protein PQ467_00935 [Novosphingobium sp. KACC 22771]